MPNLIDFIIDFFKTIASVEVMLWDISPTFCIIMNLFVYFCILGICSMKYLHSYGSSGRIP